MFGFFEIFASFFGFALGFLFNIFGNYGVSIILFTLCVNIMMFPITIRRQKNMLPSEKFEAKKEELKKRCGKDFKKFNRELMELTQEEGVNPMKGCMNVSFILTLIIFSGIYAAIQKPLSNVLHLPDKKISLAVDSLDPEHRCQKGLEQLDLIRNFDLVKDRLTMFSEVEIEKISKFSSGFKFLGLDLLKIPKFSKFKDMIWLIPVFSLLSSIISTYVMQSMSGLSSDAKGLGKYSVYLFSLFQTWIVYKVFAAVGLYLVVSGIFGIIQSILMEKFFSFQIKNAKKEKLKFIQIASNETLD
ncbi:MAG: YidC/Oxa1 family membrane protein insertase [Firmicutes bacterium]|nr:YidC/Oxa1 family membrane protein insertase [Bacillota bacterium]